MKQLPIILLCAMMAACGGSSDSATNTEPSPSPVNPPPVISDVQQGEDETYKILFMGNSHSKSHNLSQIVTAMIELGLPNETAYADNAPGIAFLAERINDGVSEDLLNSKQWTHVILQAQKYSQSGLVTYSTVPAETWIERAKAISAVPIMFPEHPLRNNPADGIGVYELHKQIAQRQPACVAPVGLAWNEAFERVPELVMHASDGNHASLTGTFLTALLFYQVITNESADVLPYMPEFNVDEATQDLLGQVASYSLELNPACDILGEAHIN